MRFVIVTGMSGAGKSSVLKMLEDAGYFCVDNLPIQLLEKFAALTIYGNEGIDKVALGIDIRSGDYLHKLGKILDELTDNNILYEILFLDCSTETLVKRYKETRRTHPLFSSSRINNDIETEREELEFLKKRANFIIDTSWILIKDLKTHINKIFVNNENYKNFFINILSFGFKYGIPTDADLVFDLRFLVNPFYILELKDKTGNDLGVKDYVMADPNSEIFLSKLYDMLLFLIPNYIAEGKNQLVIAIGCTGGKHRSVTITNELEKKLNELEYSIKTVHRDILKG
ncbi:MAG TPA: RNase adapter RapZ [Clostridiales bacterium]|nr:RNase adapter RapZ [Clostridiales bacterium]